MTIGSRDVFVMVHAVQVNDDENMAWFWLFFSVANKKMLEQNFPLLIWYQLYELLFLFVK